MKYEIEKMSEDGKKIEQPDKILKTVEEILNFTKKNSKTIRSRIKNFKTRPNA